jgi:hypothetical protein
MTKPKKRDLAQEQQEAAAESCPECPTPASADAQPQEAATPTTSVTPLEVLRNRLALMREIDERIKVTFRGPGTHEEKKDQLVTWLMEEKGLDDDTIDYIMEKKPSGKPGDTRTFYGYTFAEMNSLEDRIGSMELRAAKRQSFLAREQERRAGGGELPPH